MSAHMEICPHCEGCHCEVVRRAGNHFVECQQCHATGPHMNNDADAKNLWNRRTNPSPIPAQTGTVKTVEYKDHHLRQLVNDLRDIAASFHAAQQLRSRIADRVVRFLSASHDK